MGSVDHAESHLVVACEDGVDFRADVEQPVHCLLAAGHCPVALDDQGFVDLAAVGHQRLAPAGQPLLRFPPGPWAGDDADVPSAAG